MPRGKLWVGGTEVTPENMKDIPAAQGSTSSGTASYDPFTNTLTLRNYSYHGAGTLYDMANIRCKAGICYADDNATLTVRLKGNNSVMLTGDDNADKAGIYSAGGLRITGSGSLQAEGGPASSTYASCGIAFSGSLSFAGGTVTAAGDENTAESWGICYLPKGTGDKTITIGENTVRVMAKGETGAVGAKGNTVKVKVRNSAPGGGWLEYDGSGMIHPIGTRGEADAIEMKDVDSGGWYKTVLFGNGTFPVWVGGTQATIGNMTDIPAGQGGTKTGKASYQPFTHTLTLDNYSYKGAGYPNSGLDAAICYTDSNPLNLVLSGSNTVIQDGGSADNKAGIYSRGKLTITGDGGLTAKGGAAAKDSYGICAAGTGFEIEDSSVTVTAEGGNAGIRSCGIICLNLENYYPHEEIRIKGGTVAAAGGKSNKTSIGIYGWSVHVDAGSVTAAGGTAQDKSEGISALDSIVITSGTVNATGGAAGDYSRGIFAQDTITINGGMVTAAGGEAVNHSEGINAAGSNAEYTITIKGGIVTATGGIADESWGFNNSQNNVTVSEAISIGNSITSLTARGLTGAIRQKVKNHVEGAGWLTYYGSGEGTPIRVSDYAQELYKTIDNNCVWYQSVNFHGGVFPLWVSGIQVTTTNMGNIEGTTTPSGRSTASYDPVTNTLTLNQYAHGKQGHSYKVDNLQTIYDAAICYTDPNSILTIEIEAGYNDFYTESISPENQWRYVSAGVFSAGGLKIINNAAAGARGANAAHESYGICAVSSIEIIGKEAYEFTARGNHGEKNPPE